MAVNDVIRINAIWANNPNVAVAVNEWHFRQGTSLILDTPEEDCLDAFRTKVEPDYLFIVTSALYLIRYQVSIGPDFNTSLESDFAPIVGQKGGDPLPPRTAGLMQKKTATFSRRGRGRIFLPPANEASSGGSAATSAYRTDVDTFRDDVMTDMASGGIANADWIFSLWSEADQVARDVTSFRFVTTWSSKRSRKNLY